MSRSKPFILATPVINLKRVCLIRMIALSGQACAIAFSYFFTDTALNYAVIIATVVLTAIATFITLWRLRQSWPVSETEFFAHLLIDIISLSILLYYTGGATNPFVSYLLVPLTISAATLAWRYTWAITGLSLTAYTTMLFFYQPLAPVSLTHHHGETSFIDLHIFGMWFNFLISALLITFFVVKMAHALRDQDQTLQKTREDNLQNEQILGVATLAAGTAHELGTPLSTMSVILSELEQQHTNNMPLISDIKILKQQLHSCKATLNKLSETAEITNADTHQSRAADQYISELIDQWHVVRPDVFCEFNIIGKAPAPTIATQTVLKHAIQNLLNNAADACPEKLEISLDWDPHSWLLKIRDHGSGIAMDIAKQIGKAFFSTKEQGIGLGLFLSNATVNRYGGQIKMYNHPDGGTVTELKVPL